MATPPAQPSRMETQLQTAARSRCGYAEAADVAFFGFFWSDAGVRSRLPFTPYVLLPYASLLWDCSSGHNWKLAEISSAENFICVDAVMCTQHWHGNFAANDTLFTIGR